MIDDAKVKEIVTRVLEIVRSLPEGTPGVIRYTRPIVWEERPANEGNGCVMALECCHVKALGEESEGIVRQWLVNLRTTVFQARQQAEKDVLQCTFVLEALEMLSHEH